jgi:hypothetical protein
MGERRGEGDGEWKKMPNVVFLKKTYKKQRKRTFLEDHWLAP